MDTMVRERRKAMSNHHARSGNNILVGGSVCRYRRNEIARYC